MQATRIEAASGMPTGAGCQEEQNLPVKGKVFLLDIPFYRTRHRKAVRGREADRDCNRGHTNSYPQGFTVSANPVFTVLKIAAQRFMTNAEGEAIMWGRKMVRLNQELETLAVFDRIYDLDPNPSRSVNAAHASRQKRRSEIGVEIANLEAGKLWFKVSRKHLVSGLTTQVEKARLLLRFCGEAEMTAAIVLRRLEDRIHEHCAKTLIARGKWRPLGHTAYAVLKDKVALTNLRKV